MSWDRLDSSIADAARGGFDAYEEEERWGRAVVRPTWAGKLTIYHRGTGVVEKRGYFVGAKFEELLTRKLRAFGSGIVHPFVQLARIANERVLAPVARRCFLPNSLDSHVLSASNGRLGSGSISQSALEDETGFHNMHLTLGSLLEETTLRAPTYSHVVLTYRHADHGYEAHGNQAHVAIALFRNVPQRDLELLLPHIQVRFHIDSVLSHSPTT